MRLMGMRRMPSMLRGFAPDYYLFAKKQLSSYIFFNCSLVAMHVSDRIVFNRGKNISEAIFKLRRI